MTLYPHNQQAYEAVMKHFGEGNRKAAIVHATGTGKSYIIGAVVNHFDKVIVIAPNNFVLNETRKVCKEGTEFRTYASVMYDEEPKNDYDLIVLDEFHRSGAEKWSIGVENLLNANPNAKLLGTSATHIRYLDNARNMADEVFDGNVVSYLPLKEAIDKGILPNPVYVSSIYEVSNVIRQAQEKINLSKNGQEWKNDTMRHLRGIAHSWQEASGVPQIIKKYFTKDMKRIIVFCSKVEKVEEYRLMLGKWLSAAGFKRIRFYSIDYKENFLEREMEDFQKPCAEGQLKVAMSVNMLNEGVHVPRVDGVIMLRSTISRIIIEQQIGRCLTADNNVMVPVVIDLVNNMDTVRYDADFTFGNIYGESDTEKTTKKTTSFPFHVIDECSDIRMFLKKIENEIVLKGEDTEPHIQALLAWAKDNDNIITSECPEYTWFRELDRDHRSPYFRELYKRLKDMGLRLVSEVTEAETWMQKYKAVMQFKKENGRIPKISEPYGVWAHNQRTLANKGLLDDERALLVLRDFYNPEQSYEDKMNAIREHYKKTGKLPIEDPVLKAFLNKFQLNDFKSEHFDWTNELAAMGLKMRIPYFFHVGYPMAKESFDKKGFIDTKDNPYLKRWCTAMFINRREGKLTDEQKTLLDELDFFVRKRICNGRPVYCKKIEEVVSNIEAYYKEHGHTKGLDSPTRHFIANHKKEILNTKDLHQRLVNVKYPSFHDEDEEKFIALKELVSYGKKPKTGSSLYNFAQRNVHSHTKYTSKIKKMNLFTDQNSVIERNKEMVSNWLAENRRFPKVGKNKKIKNEEYYTYVNLTTWLKCKTEELKQFALNELAKYGISYTSSGKTKEEYVNDFKRDLEEFIETNGRIPTKKDGSIGKKLDNYRRRALRNNDTEMIKYLEGLGITVDVSTRYEEIFERNLARIIAILRAEKTITCAHPIYSLIKQYNNEYVSGRMEKSRIERFRETGFILSDNTFCTFTNGRIYNH